MLILYVEIQYFTDRLFIGARCTDSLRSISGLKQTAECKIRDILAHAFII